MKNRVGQKYGMLTVTNFVKRIKNEHYEYIWKCICECGTVKDIKYSNLKNSKSCGCLKKGKIINIVTKTTNEYFYKVFKNVEKDSNWIFFNDFKDDMYNSYIEHVKTFGQDKIILKRIDNNKRYAKNNAYWTK